MQGEPVNIDEELTELWESVYSAIVGIVDREYARGNSIEFSDSYLVKSVMVTSDGYVKLADCTGESDFAEQFTDEYLYEAYRRLTDSE